MRILFDENLPQKLRQHLPDHEVFTVGYMGWKGIFNGRLLGLAEQDFDAFITVDRALQFQPNISARRIAVVLLIAPNNQLRTLVPMMPAVRVVLQDIKPGQLIHVGYGKNSAEIIT